MDNIGKHEIQKQLTDILMSKRTDIITRSNAGDYETRCIQVPVTHLSYTLLYEIDEALINTPDYLGIAFFWAYEYRHILRNVTNEIRQQVHAEFMKLQIASN